MLYGDDQLEPAAPASPGCEALDVCGRAKFVCVAEDTSSNKLNQTLAEIETALDDALQDLDSIPTLDPSECSPACGSNEVCYERTVYPVVDESNCPSACASGEQCFQRAQSGNNMYQCMTINACAPVRSKPFYPVTPLFVCP